jgi:hypothetical protein
MVAVGCSKLVSDATVCLAAQANFARAAFHFLGAKQVVVGKVTPGSLRVYFHLTYATNLKGKEVNS